MKKITILAITLVAISFASCKKERVCTCKTTSDDPAVSGMEETKKIEYKDVTKKQAKQACVSIKIKPDGQNYTDTRTCTLD